MAKEVLRNYFKGMVSEGPGATLIHAMQEADELPNGIVGLVLIGWQLGETTDDGSRWIPQIYSEDSALHHRSMGEGRKVRPVWRLP